MVVVNTGAAAFAIDRMYAETASPVRGAGSVGGGQKSSYFVYGTTLFIYLGDILYVYKTISDF